MRETMRATVPRFKAAVITQNLPEDDLAGRPLPNHQTLSHDSSTTNQTSNLTDSEEKDMTLLQTPNDKDQVDNLDALEQTVSSIPALTLSPFRQILFIAVVCLAQFMAQAALGQAVAILHVIGAYYNITNPGVLSWLVAGYSLTVSTFILLSGRIGDVFGYKRLFIFGFLWFAVWSLIAGLAAYSNSVLFIFARVFQGIGPSICLPNGLALLGAS